MRSPLFFKIWVGYGGILYGLLSLWLAGRAGAMALTGTLLLWGAWWWETSTGFCRRCTHFHCGPHGVLMKRFFERDRTPLPGRRLRLHLAGDLLVFAWPQIWIWEWPWLGFASLAWFAVSAVAVLPFSETARRDEAKLAGVRSRGRFSG